MAYQFFQAQTNEVPVLISVPHCGTDFPDGMRHEYDPALIQAPDDTDWFVHQLYDFAPHMGMSMITAKYSRWVIDLNRDPQSKPLYNDGRIITALCPTTTFLGEPIYQDRRREVSGTEIQRRLQHYYQPYHQKIEAELQRFKTQFGRVLLWDCHSIRHQVLSIHQENFPDLILGDVEGTSASPGLIEIALKNLEASSYSLRHNYLFKGGYITRHFGKPAEGQHALQLEMTKLNYMDDAEVNYDSQRADRMRTLLKKAFEGLIRQLS